jgi:hypothetical protein
MVLADSTMWDLVSRRLTRPYVTVSSRDDALRSRSVAVLSAAFAVVGLSLTSINEVTWEQRALVFMMFTMSGWSYAGWRPDQSRRFPVYAMISLVYALFFALALFWVAPISPSFLDQGKRFSEEALTASLRMVVLGLGSMWLGMRLGVARHVFDARRMPDIPASRLRSSWIRCLVVFGALGSFMYSIMNSLSGIRAVVIVLFWFVPLVPFAVLLDAYWARAASATDKMLIGLFLVCRIGGGLGSGSLGSVVSLGFVIGASFVRARRAIPWSGVIITFCVMLFLQPAKNEYRQRFYGDYQATAFDRGAYWIGTSTELWSAFFRNGDGTVFADLASRTVERASLLTLTALVYDRTPQVVPFQRGATYKYMLITLVPRLLWPDKPSVNDGNQVYQVAYGLTRENDLTSVSIAAGMLPEAFMNFGWIGVIVVMFFMGIVYETYQHCFFSAHSGRFAGAVGLALIMQVITIESQVAQYLGGIGQQLFLTCVLLLPVLRFSSTGWGSRTDRLNDNALRLSSFRIR